MVNSKITLKIFTAVVIQVVETMLRRHEFIASEVDLEASWLCRLVTEEFSNQFLLENNCPEDLVRGAIDSAMAW